MGSPPQGGGPNHSNKNSEGRDKDLMQKICDLEKLCSALQNEISCLKLENGKLKSAICADNIEFDINTNQTRFEVYETDEEELARETDWILKKKRPSKKRKAESSPEVVSPSKTVNSVKDSTNLTKKEAVKKIPRPPPIIINGNNDFKKLHSQLTATIKKQFFIKLLNNDACKVLTFESCDYRSVTKLLSNESIPWHS